METVLDQVCASCGSARLPYGRYCLFCGDVLSEPPLKALVSAQAANPIDKAEASSPAAIEYAGFWRRTWAGAIDVALEAAGALVVTLAIDFVLARVGRMLGFEPWMSKVATGMAYIAVLTIGAWLYSAFSESSTHRATVGKRILGLEVVTGEGGRVSFGQATVRHFMKFLSLFTAGVGFMMAGWTKRHQALHDIPCDCIVVRVPREKTYPLLPN
jgi:uncharacterized RDD family membrane protein YckC